MCVLFFVGRIFRTTPYRARATTSYVGRSVKQVITTLPPPPLPPSGRRWKMQEGDIILSVFKARRLPPLPFGHIPPRGGDGGCGRLGWQPMCGDVCTIVKTLFPSSQNRCTNGHSPTPSTCWAVPVDATGIRDGFWGGVRHRCEILPDV